jgi:TonB family protein
MTMVMEDEWLGHTRMTHSLTRTVLLTLLLLVLPALADEIEVGPRHVRHYVRPTLPEIAKKMNLKGSVKLELEISAGGKVTAVRTLGGHPVLVESAREAVRNWEFDSAKESTTAPVTLVFQ